MKKFISLLKVHNSVIFLYLFMILGAILRIMTCYWGYPYPLHPDEGIIVNSAIDMISRHSYEVSVYNRPDHFEIKCCALLFQIVSYTKYHVGANYAFSEHTMTFYLVARAFTTFFGVLTIGLTYKIVSKIKSDAKLIASGLVTFFPIFIEHSAYATPDVVLTFFVLMISYLTILYLEKPSAKYLGLMCIATGIGITIKYTCAIACIWIAFIVCVDCIKRKKYFEIIKAGFFSIFFVFVTVFFLAPNLFTNVSQTLAALQVESRSVHLGADGLGFGGNAKYYFIIFVGYAGYESVIFLLSGILFCLKNRNKYTLSIGIGVLFWVCTSILSLHWARWGMPMYIFFIILVAIGISFLHDLSKKKKPMNCIICIFAFFVAFNCMVSGLAVVQSRLMTEARVDAIQFCEQNGITKENTLYDGYTPFKLNGPETINISFDESDNMIVPPGIEYLIISSNMYSRYYAEPNQYKDQINMYDNIQNQNDLIYEAGGSYFGHSNIGIVNLVKTTKKIIDYDNNTINGDIIKIYHIRGGIRGESLEFGEFSLKYTGDESLVMNENNNSLKILVCPEDYTKPLSNSNKYRISYHIYDEDNNLVIFDGARTDFGSFVGALEVDMAVDISAIPEKGTYMLEVDVVQENVAWLSDLGLQTIKLEIEVQ